MSKNDLPHMLILEPPETLTFHAPFSNKSQCVLEVTNPTPYSIYFKMKTTACHRYCVKPKMGLLLPYSQELITIRLKAPKGDSEDKFKLLSFVAPNNGDDVESAWEKFDESNAMTNRLVAVFVGGDQKRPAASVSPSVKTVTERSGAPSGLKIATFLLLIIAVSIAWLGKNFLMEEYS